MISRRKFLQLGTLATGSTLGVPLIANANSDLGVEHKEIRIAGLPSEFSHYRIGFLSDLHLGSYVPHDFILRAITLLNNESVDLVLLGGDYIALQDSIASRENGLSVTNCFDECPKNLLSHRLTSEVADLLANIRSKDGVHAVFGNHDRFTTPTFRAGIFRDYGVRNIENKDLCIERNNRTLRVIGVEDKMFGHPKLPSIPNIKPNNEWRVLLSHNPDFISETIKKTNFQFDLGLAGHTHGGQIKVPLLGALKYNIKDRELREGLSLRYGTPVYTTRGVGVVNVPIRWNCPAEVSVLSLLPA